MSNSTKPNRSRASKLDSKLSGSMLDRTLLPSRGGIGIRLKTPRATFSQKKVDKSSAAPSAINELLRGCANSRYPSVDNPIRFAANNTRITTPATIAMMKLQITPAAETQRLATRLFRQRRGFTGVGL